jgi:hypothetical protein
MRLVSRTVVGHHPLDRNAKPPVVGDSSMEKADSCHGTLIGQDLDVGDAGSVVDADVDELPTGALDARLANAMDAVTWSHDASELLDVDVQ